MTPFVTHKHFRVVLQKYNHTVRKTSKQLRLISVPYGEKRSTPKLANLKNENNRDIHMETQRIDRLFVYLLLTMMYKQNCIKNRHFSVRGMSTLFIGKQT